MTSDHSLAFKSLGKTDLRVCETLFSKLLHEDGENAAWW